jgi:hypothetical protein
MPSINGNTFTATDGFYKKCNLREKLDTFDFGVRTEQAKKVKD